MNTGRVTGALVLLGHVLGCAADVGSSTADDVGGVELRVSELEHGSGRIEYELINHTESAVHALSWKTALAKDPDRLFVVSNDGKDVPYRGAIYRRPRPRPEHYLEIAAGERVRAEVDLTQLHDLRGGGAFEVSSVVSAEALLLEAGAVEITMPAPLVMHIDGQRAAGAMDRVASQMQALMTDATCSWEQRFSLFFAQEDALANVQNAVDTWNSNGPSDARGMAWFGNHQSLPLAVKTATVLSNARNAFASDQLTYSCTTCTDSFAYVLPHLAPGVVFICPAFWSMAPSGFESMTDTLIHEVAHFYETYDIARDLQPSLDLAANNPGAAAFNADNYAYYSVDR